MQKHLPTPLQSTQSYVKKQAMVPVNIAYNARIFIPLNQAMYNIICVVCYTLTYIWSIEKIVFRPNQKWKVHRVAEGLKVGIYTTFAPKYVFYYLFQAPHFTTSKPWLFLCAPRLYNTAMLMLPLFCHQSIVSVRRRRQRPIQYGNIVCLNVFNICCSTLRIGKSKWRNVVGLARILGSFYCNCPFP